MSTTVARRTRRLASLRVHSVRRMGDRMLAALGLEAALFSVVLVGDRAMRRLNAKHRDEDHATDVLSFPQTERRRPLAPRATRRRTRARDAPPVLLGDVVISLETAARQARSRRRPLLGEVRFLLAHGLLHLVGHDHATRRQKRVMDAAARRLVRASRG